MTKAKKLIKLFKKFSPEKQLMFMEFILSADFKSIDELYNNEELCDHFSELYKTHYTELMHMFSDKEPGVFYEYYEKTLPLYEKEFNKIAKTLNIKI